MMFARPNHQLLLSWPSWALRLGNLLGTFLIFCWISSGKASDDHRSVQKSSDEVQKLEETRQWEMDVGEARALDLPSQPRAQIITFEFTSRGDVSVLVFKEVDAKGEVGLLDSDSKKALVHVR